MSFSGPYNSDPNQPTYDPNQPTYDPNQQWGQPYESQSPLYNPAGQTQGWPQQNQPVSSSGYQAPPLYPSAPPPRRGRPSWLIPVIVGAVVVLVLCCGIGVFGLIKASDDTVDPVTPIYPPSTSSASSVPASTVAPSTVPPTTNSNNLTSAEQAYIDRLSERPYFSTVPVQTALDSGNAVCNAFDQGVSFNDIAESFVSAGVPGYEAGWLIGAAVRNLCSQHESKLPS